MKKILLFLLLLGASVCANAQKSYINVCVTNIDNTSVQFCHMTGDIPDGINHNPSMFIGDLLNMLSQYGYEVELMSFSTGNSTLAANYLLSKKSSTDPDNPDIVTYQRDIADDTEAYEVARYNLQGLPINKDEKGVQIVVYSNYTTKTVIVE